jgi:hypothetical protein
MSHIFWDLWDRESAMVQWIMTLFHMFHKSLAHCVRGISSRIAWCIYTSTCSVRSASRRKMWNVEHAEQHTTAACLDLTCTLGDPTTTSSALALRGVVLIPARDAWHQASQRRAPWAHSWRFA